MARGHHDAPNLSARATHVESRCRLWVSTRNGKAESVQKLCAILHQGRLRGRYPNVKAPMLVRYCQFDKEAPKSDLPDSRHFTCCLKPCFASLDRATAQSVFLLQTCFQMPPAPAERTGVQ